MASYRNGTKTKQNRAWGDCGIYCYKMFMMICSKGRLVKIICKWTSFICEEYKTVLNLEVLHQKKYLDFLELNISKNKISQKCVGNWGKK